MINYWIYCDLFLQYFGGIKFKKMSDAAGKHQWTIIEVFEI